MVCSKNCKCTDCKNHEEWKSIQETTDRFRSLVIGKGKNFNDISPVAYRIRPNYSAFENSLGISKRTLDTDIREVKKKCEFKRKMNLRPGI